jgi:hypothetical protein
MENVRKMFQDCQSSTSLNINEESSVYLLYNSISNFITRIKPSVPLPHMDSVLEILISKTPQMKRLQDEVLVIADDVIPNISGTISYLEFA